MREERGERGVERGELGAKFPNPEKIVAIYGMDCRGGNLTPELVRKP